MDPAESSNPDTPTPPEGLALACHRAWSLPLVGALSAFGGGAKYITLANHLGAPRDSVSAAIDHMCDFGFVSPNPGYGHPMRPEYLLTPAGRAIGPDCQRLITVLDTEERARAGRRKWLLATVLAIGSGASSFGQLRRALAGATPRAVSQTLRAAVGAELVVRLVDSGHPPGVRYRLTAAGQRLLPVLIRLGTACAAQHARRQDPGLRIR